MEQKRKKFRADIILIAAVILIGAVLAAVLLFTQKSGSKVCVKIDGRIVSEYSLFENGEYVITSDSDGTNTLKIENNEAWIEEANCPDGLCINMGRISRAGQSIVCLPHKLVIEITGDSKSADDIDVYVK